MPVASMLVMRARPNTPSVLIRIWCARNERAGTPASCNAMATRATETCSPVATNTSDSRASGCEDKSLASFSKRLVSPAMAETTTMTRFPAARVTATRCATARMRSMLPTEVPPYFWTINATALACLQPT
jgi:hypothetical protein